MASDTGIQSEERMVSITEVIEKIQSGELTEAFGTGTAAVISPVGKIIYGDGEYIINHHKTGPYTKRFYDILTGIQYGEIEDKYGWVYKVM